MKKNEAEASCDNTICDEPKMCLNGDCVCPIGYTGTDCKEEVLPSIVRVKEIIVTNFPAENPNGSPWDDTGGPDIAVAIYKESEQLFFSTIKQDVNSSDTHNFSCNYTFSSSLFDTYYIPLTEWDDGTYQLIGEMLFKPYEKGTGFPETLAIFPIDTTRFNLRGKVVLSYSF